MAHIELKNIKKSFGLVDVIKGVDLEVFSGEFMVFVGPSGCGKSTLLRLMAGLEDITSGEMTFDGTLVNALAPSKRGIAMVFQSYALYPHMTVYENMAYGLKLRKVPKADIERKVQAAARLLTLGEQLAKRPKQLSGGQRQRVALGRAIVQQLFGNTPELSVIAIDPELERMLQQVLGAAGDDGGGLEPELAETLAREIAAAAQQQEAAGTTPVLLVADRLRLAVSRLMRRAAPSLAVLAHGEIPDARTIRVRVTVGGKR